MPIRATLPDRFELAEARAGGSLAEQWTHGLLFQIWRVTRCAVYANAVGYPGRTSREALLGRRVPGSREVMSALNDVSFSLAPGERSRWSASRARERALWHCASQAWSGQPRDESCLEAVIL